MLPAGLTVTEDVDSLDPICLVIIVALAALFFVLHSAGGATSSSTAPRPGTAWPTRWCKDCHAIEAAPRGPPTPRRISPKSPTGGRPRRFRSRYFSRPITRTMPNIVIAPDQADELANYILSLKRN